MADHVHSTSLKKIRAAFFINVGFTVVELIGGFYTNSIAILSDALHDLGDSLSLGAAWYFQKVSQRGRNREFSYGYRRFSLLGAIVNSIVLVIGSIVILYEALPRLWEPTLPDAKGMIFFAIGGIVANGWAAYRLHGGHSINERAVYLHLLEDVLGWVATLIAALLMYFKSIPIIDPILAILISAFILFNVYKNFKKAVRIILQGAPEEIDQEEIKRKLSEIPEIRQVHDFHIWSMDGQYHILSIHAVVNKALSVDELATIKSKAKQLLKEHQIDHSTIEFETEEESCDHC